LTFRNRLNYIRRNISAVILADVKRPLFIRTHLFIEKKTTRKLFIRARGLIPSAE